MIYDWSFIRRSKAIIDLDLTISVAPRGNFREYDFLITFRKK